MMLRCPTTVISSSWKSCGWAAEELSSSDCRTSQAATQRVAHDFGLTVLPSPDLSRTAGYLAAPLSTSDFISVRRSWTARRDYGKKGGRVRGNLWFASTQSPGQPGPAKEKSFWPSLFPRGPIYSSNFSDVDAVQLSELWLRTLNVKREPEKIMKALRHSFAFVVVLVEDENAPPEAGTRLKTVGVGRAVSDGSFIATICDVAVDPAYRHRGIGRRLVKTLVEKMKKIGGPSGFAVFPPPVARRFFWKIGFRSDRKYKLMAYRGPIQNPPIKSDGVTSLQSDGRLVDGK